MTCFYNLNAPTDDPSVETIYGQSAWVKRYGMLELEKDVAFRSVFCTSNPSHQRAGPRLGKLIAVAPQGPLPDLLWTWGRDCIVSDQLKLKLEDAGLRGFEMKEAAVRVRSITTERQGSAAPAWWELIARSQAQAHPDSHIRLLRSCPICGLLEYSSFSGGLVVNEESWDGSDFFVLREYPGFLLITERVVTFIESLRLDNCSIVRSKSVTWPDAVMRPED